MTLSSSFDHWIELNNLDEEQEISILNAVGSKKHAGIIVLDGYSLDTDYQRKVTQTGNRLVCIDDIHSYDFISDLVINHSPRGDLLTKYRLSSTTSTAFGLAFSLLRQPFLRAAREPKLAGSKVDAPFYLAFGGADIYNVTGRLIQKLAEAGYTNKLIVVLGASNQHAEAVRAKAAQYLGEVSMYQSLEDNVMIDLYRQSSLAFLPASTTLLEAIAVGVPIVTGYYVDNQHDIYQGFANDELVDGIGDWGAIDTLNNDFFRDLIQKAIRGSSKESPIDGYSDLNLLSIFDQLQNVQPLLVGRPASDREAKIYWDWVNEKAVRSNSIQSDAIPLKDHLGWYQQKLQDNNSLLLYYEYQTQPCGQVRFDVNDRHEALLDYSVDQSMRGQGFGVRLLQLGEQQLRGRFPHVLAVVAIVKADNRASCRALKGNDYQLVYDRQAPDGFIVYEKQLSA